MDNQKRITHIYWLKALGFMTGLLLCLPAMANQHHEAMAGEYVIKLRTDRGSPAMRQFAKAFNGRIKSFMSRRSRTIVLKKSILERADVVMAALRRHPMVEIVEPNYIFRAVAQPNDSRLNELWGMINQRVNNGIDISAEAAWDISTGSRDVVVGVIDSGVDYTHIDLKNNMWTNDAEKNGQEGVDDDGNGYIDDIYGYDFANSDNDPMDDNDHGSHCSGTIGAEGDNGTGVAGVNWKVRIMALKFLKGNGAGTLEAAIKAIDYGVENGANILNNSWGGGGFSEILKQAIERAEQKGVLFVAAAGNSALNNDVRDSYPANYDIPNVISVAAIDSNGKLARFSNYGKQKVHIAAPGVEVLSTVPGGYKSIDGTSMASPHVAGVAALLLAEEPNLSYQDVKDRLLATVKPLPSLSNKVLSGGVVNAYLALTNTLPEPDPNDPNNWESVEQNVSTAHPYVNNFTDSYQLTVPGAEKVAVHFSRFETERRYDTVVVKDGQGKVFGTLTGNLGTLFSPVVDGDTIVLEFQSDRSVTTHGFDIDKIAYTGPGQGTNSWRSQAESVSTPHPYSNLFEDQQSFTIPGAQEIRIQFNRFETESGYDKLTFLDGNDNVLDVWDGTHDGELSPVAAGDTIKIRFKTDFSVTRYGFDIESLSYR